MGTVQYIKDLLETFKEGKIPFPLNQYASFDSYNILEIKNHDKVYNCNIIQADLLDLNKRKLRIKLYEGFSANSELPCCIIIDTHTIYLNNQWDQDVYELSKDALFNLSVEYDIPFSVQDLFDIQEKYSEVISNSAKFNNFLIYYTNGEEKYYGY